MILEEKFPSDNFNHKETVFTIGNGYLSTRGSFEEGFSGENAATFVHGVFNDVPTYNTEIVNFPNIFRLQIFFEDEEFNLETGKVLDYRRELHMNTGLLRRDVSWESPLGKTARLTFERFTNMDDIHHAAVRLTIQEVNFNGKISIQAPINGFVSNQHYRHWDYVHQGILDADACYLHLSTSATRIQAAIAEKIEVIEGKLSSSHFYNVRWSPTLWYEFEADPCGEIVIEKHVQVYTSREVSQSTAVAVERLHQAAEKGFDSTLGESEDIWNDLWSRSNVKIEGDDLADRSLRFNLFQVLIAAPRHDDHVSIGAKTLSGYGYRGHVFWDTEIFLLPFLIFTQPKIARNILMYRYHTLAGAREKARQQGYKGAMFAWESAATGEEVTPAWVIGSDQELVRIWCGEIEQHITADVAYAIRQYWQVTGDDDFMIHFGVEVVLSAAQFYASRLKWDQEDSQYHIRDVIGPDEYHEHVNDNAMTNLLAGWTLEFASEVALWMYQQDPDQFQILLKTLELTSDEIRSWTKMANKKAVYVQFDSVIEQFDGFFDLVYQEQKALEPRDQSLQSLYGIQGVQAYQFIKQPDVVMALFLLRERFSEQQIMKNLAYYTDRTDLTWGSSLGPSIQALMLARYKNVEQARELLIKTLFTDLENNRGNTDEGIHAASAGAVWQVILMGFLRFGVKDGMPKIHPQLPAGWHRLRMKICWKKENLAFDIF